MILQREPRYHQSNFSASILSKISSTKQRVDRSASHPRKACSSKNCNMMLLRHGSLKVLQMEASGLSKGKLPIVRKKIKINWFSISYHIYGSQAKLFKKEYQHYKHDFRKIWSLQNIMSNKKDYKIWNITEIFWQMRQEIPTVSFIHKLKLHRETQWYSTNWKLPTIVYSI